ncbi:MAG: hypothetical protein LBU09_04860 [Endomicrobium sp.]|jgi:hypothetical protein|nr:hypothetical protein [Endomicrobium sp.]
MNRWEDLFVSLAGPLADRLAAVGVNKYLDAYEYNIPEYLRSFLGMTYIYERTWFAGYIFCTNIEYLLDSYHSDWFWVTNRITNSDKWILHYGVITLFTAFAVFDIIYSWDEIKKNYNRMMGKYPARREERANSKIQMQFLNVKSTGDSFVVEQSWKF